MDSRYLHAPPFQTGQFGYPGAGGSLVESQRSQRAALSPRMASFLLPNNAPSPTFPPGLLQPPAPTGGRTYQSDLTSFISSQQRSPMTASPRFGSFSDPRIQRATGSLESQNLPPQTQSSVAQWPPGSWQTSDEQKAAQKSVLLSHSSALTFAKSPDSITGAAEGKKRSFLDVFRAKKSLADADIPDMTSSAVFVDARESGLTTLPPIPLRNGMCEDSSGSSSSSSSLQADGAGRMMQSLWQDPDKFRARMRKWFLFFSAPHPLGPDFDRSLKIPNLQFQESHLEKFYKQEFFVKKMRMRVITFCIGVLFLLSFQFGYGYRNHTKGPQIPYYPNNPPVSLSHSAMSYPSVLGSITNDQSGISKSVAVWPPHFSTRTSTNSRCVLGLADRLRNKIFGLFSGRGAEGTLRNGRSAMAENANPSSHTRRLTDASDDIKNNQTQCMIELFLDLFIVVVWLGLSCLSRMEKRLANMNVIMQGTRILMYAFFSQGVFSPCVARDGTAYMISNNLAIVSTSVVAFNTMNLSRVRHSALLTGIWAVAVIEIGVLIMRGPESIIGSDDGAAFSKPPFLALAITLLVCLPALGMLSRLRGEMAEREALFYAVRWESERQLAVLLQNDISELQETTKDVNIQEAIAEGVLPNTIVQLAVIELKLASKTLINLSASLPSAMMPYPSAATGGADVTPSNRVVDYASPGVNQRDNSLANLGFPSSVKYVSVLEKPPTRTLGAASRMLLPSSPGSPETMASEGPYRAAAAPVNHGLSLMWDATYDLRSRVDCALRLLTRSGDMLGNKESYDPAQKIVLFHALGHDVTTMSKKQSTATPASGDPGSKDGGLSHGVSPYRTTPNSQSGYLPEPLPNVANPANRRQLDGPHQTGAWVAAYGEVSRNAGITWSFDFVRVARELNDGLFCVVAEVLAVPVVDRLSWLFDWTKFRSFASGIQSEYGRSSKIPYHNRTHAAIHAHTSTLLCNWLGFNKGLSSAEESLAILIASLCHDVGHPGRTNAYLVNANRHLAIRYNDTSVLENFHACRTFEVLRKDECNFFADQESDIYRAFRKQVIELILATDMKHHFELINNFKLKRGCAGFDMNEDESKMLTLKLIMKAADLSHGAFDWSTHRHLTMAVAEEFWSQGDAEEKLGLPKSPLCDRQPREVPKSQVGFLEFVVTPLFKELAGVDPSGNIVNTCDLMIKANIAKWKLRASEEEEKAQNSPSNANPPAAPTPPAAKITISPPSASPILLLPSAQRSPLRDSPRNSRRVTINVPRPSPEEEVEPPFSDGAGPSDKQFLRFSSSFSHMTSDGSVMEDFAGSPIVVGGPLGEDGRTGDNGGLEDLPTFYPSSGKGGFVEGGESRLDEGRRSGEVFETMATRSESQGGSSSQSAGGGERFALPRSPMERIADAAAAGSTTGWEITRSGTEESSSEDGERM